MEERIMDYINGRFKKAPVTKRGVNETDNAMGSLIDDGERDLIKKKKGVKLSHKKASELL